VQTPAEQADSNHFTTTCGFLCRHQPGTGGLGVFVWDVGGLEVSAATDGVRIKGESPALADVGLMARRLHVAQAVHQNLARGVGAAAVKRRLMG
jgi:hypothetical protein